MAENIILYNSLVSDRSLSEFHEEGSECERMIYLTPEYFSETGQIEKTEKRKLLTDVTQSSLVKHKLKPTT